MMIAAVLVSTAVAFALTGATVLMVALKKGEFGTTMW